MTGETYVSTGAFRTRDLPEILEAAAGAGLHRLELSSGVAFRPDLRDGVRRYLGRPHRYLVHNYFPPPETPFVLNLASNDPETLARSRAHCEGALDLAAEVGAPFYSVHSGFALHATPEQLGRPLGAAPTFPYEEAYAIFVESVRHLAAYGAGRGVRFLVENNVVAPFNLARGENRWLLMAEAGELLRLARDVASANLGFLVDVGHVNVSARSLGFDRRAFVEAVAGHVAAFHLSDNDGAADDNRPFDTAAWFVPLLRELPGAAVVIEAYRLELAQIRACAAVVEAARAR